MMCNCKATPGECTEAPTIVPTTYGKFMAIGETSATLEDTEDEAITAFAEGVEMKRRIMARYENKEHP